VIALVALAFAGARGVVPAASPPRGLANAYASRRVALVVGIDAYTDPALAPLHFAAKDARDVAAVLSDPAKGDYDVVSVLSGDVPRAAFWQAFQAVTSHLQRDDTFVVYIAAHGTLDLGARGTSLYVLPSDAWLADAASDGISVQALADAVSRLPARRRVTILDTCHSVGGRSALSPDTQRRIDGLRGPVPPPAALEVSELDAHLYAAHYNQPAMEDAALGNGVYTHFLIEALSGAGDLDGDGLVDVTEAHGWARDRTLEYTGGAQVPWSEVTTVGREAITLAGDPARRTRAEHALIVGLEGLPANATLSVDGIPRGAGPVEPGARDLSVTVDGIERVRSEVHIAEGARVDVADLVRARDTRLSLGASGSAGVGGDVMASFGAGLEAWGLPADPSGMRLAVGGAADVGLGPVGTLGSWPTGTALARGAVLWGDRVVFGPMLGAGVLWRRPPSGGQAAPVVAPGLVLAVDVGGLRVSAEPDMLVLAVDGAAVAIPRLSLSVGWEVR
jgi:uncharacterized caspase-like protein